MNMKMRFGLLAMAVVFVFMCLFVSACSQTTTTATTGKITGTIMAANGTTPIAAASVYLKTDTTKITTTDANGAFSLEGAWIVSGSYVLVAEKGGFKLEFTVAVTASNTTTNAGSKEVSPSDPNATIPDLAVVAGSFDDIGSIITALGYTYETITISNINNNFAFISTFEAIFLNCGASASLTASGEANLSKFVTVEGKSVYASDWSAEYIYAVWPSAVNWYGGTYLTAKIGNSQTITAEVVDTHLQTVLGKTTASIYYNLPGWVVISSEGTGTTVLMNGSPATSASSVYSSSIRSSSPVKAAKTLSGVPLAVQFQPGGSTKGTVVYTTFHNEAGVTTDVTKILQDFIFRL